MAERTAPPPGSTRPLRVLGIGNARSIIFQRWAWRLRELGHDVHVVTDRLPVEPAELDGVVVHDVRALGRLNRARGVRRLLFGRTIARLARSLDVDLVHGHYLLPYGYWAALSGIRPLVTSPWGTDVLIDGQKPGRDRRRATAAVRAADAVVVNSEAAARAAVALGADTRSLEKIVWYADLERFGPERRDDSLRARLGWPDDSLLVLSLRNFRPDTNVDVVVEAFALVVREEPRARLVLASKGGPLRGEIDSLVDRLGLRQVVAFHSASEAELPALVASADVLVAMTRSDSTPSSLLEAMASGLPAVCAEAASVDEWLTPGEGGEIVPQRDEHALSAAVLALLRDPALRQAYGRRNRELVAERIPAGGPGPALEDLYRRTIEEARAVRRAPARSRATGWLAAARAR